MTLTVLTPTYNRADFLNKLYDSLTAQTRKDFEWLVVDDGSTDNTEKILEGFISQNKISITVIKQKNGGKHRALNNGIEHIESNLTFIVDSDDYHPENAIETILAYNKKYTKMYDVKTGVRSQSDANSSDKLCGYSFLRCGEDGSVNTSYFPTDELIDTFQNVRINGGIGGDKAEVFFTSILKRYQFPEFEGENFLPEDIVWMRMSGPYKMVHINKNVYTCEYHENGLTKSGHTMKIHSPNGMMLRSEIYLTTPGIRAKVRLKMMMLYIIYSHFAGCNYHELNVRIRSSFLYWFCYIPAQIVYCRWRNETGV